MTQDQFIKQEIYKLFREEDEAIDAVELARIVDEEISWDFSEDEKKIHIEGHGYNHVYRWSDDKGILGLCNAIDEDAEFDEKYQEGEL